MEGIKEMISNFHKIRNAIEKALNLGKRNFIIYPYGENGALTKQILNDSFGIEECYLVDNKLSKFNSHIKSLDWCKALDYHEYTILFTCANCEIYEEVRSNLYKYFPVENVVEIFEMKVKEKIEKKDMPRCNTGGVYQNIYGTKCGKYSYGSLCDHWLVKSVGAFCSFAPGVDVVENHPIHYLSTHLFLYYGSDSDKIHIKTWDDFKGGRSYFEGIKPKGDNYRLEKIKIGSDVWLGRNVLITNSSNIGNGVIAGAGAVITKDVPDYAVVAGVPAKIIRYRYTEEEIEALNRIAWWNWSDEKIRENYNDFFLNIKEFIDKHNRIN